MRLTDCVSNPCEIRPHLCDAKDRIWQDPGLATGFNHRERRLQLVELVNRILLNVYSLESHLNDAIAERTHTL